MFLRFHQRHKPCYKARSSAQAGGIAMEYLLVTIFAAGLSLAILTAATVLLESQLQVVADRWQLDFSLSLADLWPRP